jgi:hypothetical protein
MEDAEKLSIVLLPRVFAGVKQSPIVLGPGDNKVLLQAKLSIATAPMDFFLKTQPKLPCEPQGSAGQTALPQAAFLMRTSEFMSSP